MPEGAFLWTGVVPSALPFLTQLRGHVHVARFRPRPRRRAVSIPARDEAARPEALFVSKKHFAGIFYDLRSLQENGHLLRAYLNFQPVDSRPELRYHAKRASGGSGAAETDEPCQVRKEAALRRILWVPSGAPPEAFFHNYSFVTLHPVPFYLI